MEYVEINGTKRIGYEVRPDYDSWYLAEEAIELAENNIYFKYATSFKNLKDLAIELAEDMTLKQLVGRGFDDEIVDLLYYSSDIEYFTSDEYRKDMELLSSSEILNKDIEGLEECLNTWAAYELWGYKDYLIELIENDDINDLLINKEVIKNEWRGYNQGDYDEIYTLVEFKNEEESKEERIEKRKIAEEDFEYLSCILRGDVYSFIVAEELVYYKELNGDRTLNNWEEVRSDSIGGIAADYYDLEDQLKTFLQDFLSKEDFQKVIQHGLNVDVKY